MSAHASTCAIEYGYNACTCPAVGTHVDRVAGRRLGCQRPPTLRARIGAWLRGQR